MAEMGHGGRPTAARTELRCAGEPYWSNIWVLGANASGMADARTDCTTTASGLADGSAGTPWVIDYPPHKYAAKGDITTS